VAVCLLLLAHRVVTFAIAQLSCYFLGTHVNMIAKNNTSGISYTGG